MRLRWLASVAIAALPATTLLWVHGCSTEKEELENLCGFLGDPESCLMDFVEDVGATCGAAGRGSAPLGRFGSRDALDICILNEGGQVVFDPPINLKAFPPAAGNFTFIRSDGTVCGSAGFNGPYGMSLGVSTDPAAAGGDAGPPDEAAVLGGTFSVTPSEGEIFETSCPAYQDIGGQLFPAEEQEVHRFDRLELAECPQYSGALPRAEIEANAGGILLDGYVRFRLLFPPAGALDLANVEPEVVEYFDCAIPGAPPSCINGQQDALETDQDCGGPTGTPPNPDDCPSRCGDGQKCIEDSDCDVGFTCQLKSGLKKCLEDTTTGVGGAGGAGGATTSTTTTATGAGGAGGDGGAG